MHILFSIDFIIFDNNYKPKFSCQNGEMLYVKIIRIYKYALDNFFRFQTGFYIFFIFWKANIRIFTKKLI